MLQFKLFVKYFFYGKLLEKAHKEAQEMEKRVEGALWPSGQSYEAILFRFSYLDPFERIYL